MIHQQLEVITVGSALRDVLYYTSECGVRQNGNDPLKLKLMCVEYGAKICSREVFFGMGGGAANTAINFANLGVPTGVLTAVGFDFDGREIKEQLSQKNIDTSLVNISAKSRTGFSFIVVNRHTGDHTAFVYYGAVADLQVRESTLAQHPTTWYYIASINSPRWIDLLNKIFAVGGRRVAWNPGSSQLAAGWRGLQKYFNGTEILILNKDEATELMWSHPKFRRQKKFPIRQMLKILTQRGPKIVVITDSRRGSHAAANGKFYFQRAGTARPVDTTGAGDCYASTFVAAYMEKPDIATAMRFATVNANALVQTSGAQNGLLTWRQLKQKVKYLP